MDTNKIHYSYHTDPENPYRVITVARRVGDDEGTPFVEFAWAVCRPLYKDTKRKDPLGDQHSKKLARKIARGRLLTGGLVVFLEDGEHPLRAVQLCLADPDIVLPRFIQRTFHRALVHAAQRLGTGDLSARSGLAYGARSGELGELTRAFDQMADSVEAHTREEELRRWKRRSL